jgi:hypothetical protein
MQSDFPALTSGTIQADDKDAILQFVEEDLGRQTVRAVVVGATFVRVVTDLATYGVKVVDNCLGMIENANKRRPDDYIYDAVEVHHRLHLARTRGSAEARVPSATHPLSGREMRELRRHQRESPSSPFVFVSERGAPLSAPGFSRMVERAVAEADLGIKAHAHMLRHACGYKLANDGHDTRAIQAYLGHRNIQNTTRYTALAPQRFKEFFRD